MSNSSFDKDDANKHSDAQHDPWACLPNKLMRYLVQTRKEIDTEKRERDQILNFIIVTIGGLGFVTA